MWVNADVKLAASNSSIVLYGKWPPISAIETSKLGCGCKPSADFLGKTIILGVKLSPPYTIIQLCGISRACMCAKNLPTCSHAVLSPSTPKSSQTNAVIHARFSHVREIFVPEALVFIGLGDIEML